MTDQSARQERTLPSRAEPSPSGLVEHFFRHESGRLVSVLIRLFGLRHLDLVEDMVQATLFEALQVWRVRGIPDEPSAWMHRVARNKVVDALRRRETLLRIAPAWARLHPRSAEAELDDLFLDSGIEDSELRLFFACCHPQLSRENQIALTLKSLGGFSNAEIARRVAGLGGNDQETDPTRSPATDRSTDRAHGS